MNEECIYECIDIGQNKYRYMHETFDEMFTGPWTFKIKQNCRLFHQFLLYRDERAIMVNSFNKETKRLLLLKRYCCDIANKISLYV